MAWQLFWQPWVTRVTRVTRELLKIGEIYNLQQHHYVAVILAVHLVFLLWTRLDKLHQLRTAPQWGSQYFDDVELNHIIPRGPQSLSWWDLNPEQTKISQKNLDENHLLKSKIHGINDKEDCLIKTQTNRQNFFVTDTNYLWQTQGDCDKNRLSGKDTHCLWQTHNVCDGHNFFLLWQTATVSDRHRLSVTDKYCLWHKQ